MHFQIFGVFSIIFLSLLCICAVQRVLVLYANNGLSLMAGLLEANRYHAIMRTCENTAN